jgi:hypothetical protein
MAKQYTGEPEWRHPTQPMWAVFYPATWARADHWQAYRSVGTSNKRVGDENGFASLEDAIAACESA